jgi:hypothetical protein
MKLLFVFLTALLATLMVMSGSVGTATADPPAIFREDLVFGQHNLVEIMAEPDKAAWIYTSPSLNLIVLVKPPSGESVGSPPDNIRIDTASLSNLHARRQGVIQPISPAEVGSALTSPEDICVRKRVIGTADVTIDRGATIEVKNAYVSFAPLDNSDSYPLVPADDDSDPGPVGGMVDSALSQALVQGSVSLLDLSYTRATKVRKLNPGVGDCPWFDCMGSCWWASVSRYEGRGEIAEYQKVSVCERFFFCSCEATDLLKLEVPW